MKTISKLAFMAAMVLTAGTAAFAQTYLEDPRYGETPEMRAKNAPKLSYLKAEMDARNYDAAATFVRELMNDAPLIPNLYNWGATVYSNKALRATSLDQKKVYIDSVLLIYERRLQYNANHPTQGAPYIMTRRAREYVTLNPMDRERVRQFYKQAVEAHGDAAEAALVLEYFQQLVTDFKNVDISADVLLGEFEALSPVMENAEQADRDTFTSLLATSGAANCEMIEELYTKLLANDPNDLATLTKAYNMMAMINCTSEFFTSVAERYYAQAPSSGVAIRLASAFENRGEFERALKYLNEMLAAETDTAEKGKLYTRIAASEIGAKRPSAAAQAARSAIAINPDDAFAHYFLGEAYVAGSSGCGEFHNQTVFWLAADEFERARALFIQDGASTERVDERLSLSRRNFPTFEDGIMFVNGYENGKPYTVSCGWISGRTTIRSR